MVRFVRHVTSAQFNATDARVRAKAEGRQPVGMEAETAALFPGSFEDSPLGPIPSGWRIARLADVVEVIDCLHSRKPERADDGPVLLQLSNISDDGLVDVTDAYHISDEDYAEWTSRMEAKEGDCVVTNVGRVGPWRRSHLVSQQRSAGK